jgi:hypothetical protein
MAEVRNDYTDDQNYTYIDYWKTDSDEEEGKTIAIVCRDTKKVFFIDNRYRIDSLVTEAINEVLKQI